MGKSNKPEYNKPGTTVLSSDPVSIGLVRMCLIHKTRYVVSWSVQYLRNEKVIVRTAEKPSLSAAKAEAGELLAEWERNKIRHGIMLKSRRAMVRRLEREAGQ